MSGDAIDAAMTVWCEGPKQHERVEIRRWPIRRSPSGGMLVYIVGPGVAMLVGDDVVTGMPEVSGERRTHSEIACPVCEFTVRAPGSAVSQVAQQLADLGHTEVTLRGLDFAVRQV